MQNSDAIRNLFDKKENDKIFQTYSPEVVAESLGFKKSLHLAYQSYNVKKSKELQKYAAHLIEAVKIRFPDEWVRDWHFEAFLGDAYDAIVEEEEENYNKRYQAYFCAYERADPPPPALMIKLAKCMDIPGCPQISYEDVAALAKTAFEIEPNSIAAGILCDIYSVNHMDKESRYWAHLRDDLQNKCKEFSLLEPFFVSEGYKQAEMQNADEIKSLFLKKENDRIYQNYSQDTVAAFLGFKDSLRLAYRLLYNAAWKEDPQRYAAHLIEAVKNRFPDDWNQDWRYEAFLGSAYGVLSGWDEDFDECYKAYFRAYKKANPVPPELLIELARCSLGPEGAPVSYEQAIEWSNKSLELEPYADAAGLLSAIYFSKGDEKARSYWQGVMKELEAKGKTLPPLEPEFVRDGYK